MKSWVYPNKRFSVDHFHKDDVHFIVILDAANTPTYVCRLTFVESLNFAVSVDIAEVAEPQYIHTHALTYLMSKPHIIRGIITAIAACISDNTFKISSNMIFVAPIELFDVMNAMLCSARIKAMNIKQIMMSMSLETARHYRYVDGTARKIQRAWKRSIADPSYHICQKRLIQEWRVISGEFALHAKI
jgi:hypothetical protein